MAGGYIGIGKESADASPAAAPVYFPFITSDQEMCEECGAIRARDSMEACGCDEDGLPLYRCPQH